MFWNSALSSVKIVPRNVSIAGPAGTQLSEHGEPGVEQGATVARATLTDGSWKLLEIAPEKEAREKTTAKTRIFAEYPNILHVLAAAAVYSGSSAKLGFLRRRVTVKPMAASTTMPRPVVSAKLREREPEGSGSIS